MLIGSGLGSLSCAAVLAAAGRRVTVCESHYRRRRLSPRVFLGAVASIRCPPRVFQGLIPKESGDNLVKNMKFGPFSSRFTVGIFFCLFEKGDLFIIISQKSALCLVIFKITRVWMTQPLFFC